MISSPQARLCALSILMWALLCGAVHDAGAVQPPAAPSLDVDRLGAEALPAADAAAARDALARSSAWLEWADQHPRWRVAWNLRARTPHRLYGPGLQIEFAPADAARVEAACRALLVQSAPLTGIRDDALRLAAADRRLGRWYVVFEQIEAGLPVRGGRADVRVTDTGAVQLFGADWHRHPSVDARPRVAAAAALAAAAADLGPTTDFAHELVILPEPRDAAYVYHLAHELRFRTAEPRGVWRAWVDAHSGDLLRRENEIRYAQLTGRVTAEVESTTIGDPFVAQPLRDTRFNVGTSMTELGFTDADGFYDVTTAAVDTVDVRVRLLGRWARVFNSELGFATPAILARMFPGTSRDFLWNDSNSRASERDAYYHALIAHQTIKELDPTFTGVDYQMPVTVDIFDRDCNAFWDGLGINFFGQSMRCVNTARIADVVYHEYGHGITDRQYRPLTPSGAMHEGFSDYYAASINDDPRIGRGFRGPGTILRTVDNDNTFPDDIVGEVHRDGLILAGALWDLRQTLGRGATDSLFHYARYGRADNFDDYLLDVLVTDDDNGDIYDGTPRFDAIIAAFAGHGIGDYSVQIAHTPEADTEDLNKPLVLEAVILSIFQLEPGSQLLHYAVNGGAWNTLPLAPTGMAVREFGATIPMQPAGTQVAYYITAADSAGNAASLPPGGATAPFEFRVGADVTPPVIVHDPLPDQPADAPAGWPVRAVVTDNLDRGLAEVRTEYTINGVTGGGTLAMAPLGNDVWATTLPMAGVVLGDTIFYRVGAVDSAQTPNIMQAPPAGAYDFTIVPGLARDLEASDAGLIASGDWEWGVPAGEPAAFTGTNVWGTGLVTGYSDDTESILEIGPIDMTTWTRAALVFQHWLDSESFYDGGCVEISTNNGLDWTLVQPSGGYPLPFVLALANAGYSGNLQGWQRAEFELSQFVGQQVLMRWRFASDSGVIDRGWFIDDIEVVARQVLSIPLALQAESGFDSAVRLDWSSPAGVAPPPTTPLLGYHVYRAGNADLSDAVQLTDSPLGPEILSYVDVQAINGVLYHYAVTALYAEGESRPSNVADGMAYVSAYSADTAALDVHVVDGATADTTITFTNTGTGFLHMNLWLGEASDDDIDDVRIAYQRIPPGMAAGARRTRAAAKGGPAAVAKGGGAGEAAAAATGAPAPTMDFAALVAAWRRAERPDAAAARTLPVAPADAGGYTLLFADAQEGSTPDIKELLVEENASGETRFRVTGWAPWGNVFTDFTMVLGMDTDTDRSTGQNGGFDYFVVAGAFALSTFGTPAVVLQGQTVVTVPTHQFFPTNADVLEFGFPFDFIGNPARLLVQVIAFDPALQVPRDFAPGVPSTAQWLQPQAFHVVAPAGVPTPLGLSFASIVPGHYAGKVFFETNAPASPVVVLPVGYHVTTTAVALSDLTALQEDADVVVRWRTSGEVDVAAFRVHRSRDGGPEQALSPDVEPSAGRAYVFRDRDPAPGSYTYRIGEVAPDGSVTLHGAVEITTVRVAPAVSFLDPAVPNPFNPTTTLRFGVAVAGPADVVVFDSRGRRVRTLWRAAHVEPGFRRVTWDGRDDAGVRVASGVYHVRLQTAGRALTRRLTLVK
jgi:hypothetical protein